MLDEGPAEEGKGAVAAEVDSAMFVGLFKVFDIVRRGRSMLFDVLDLFHPTHASNSCQGWSNPSLVTNPMTRPKCRVTWHIE